MPKSKSDKKILPVFRTRADSRINRAAPTVKRLQEVQSQATRLDYDVLHELLVDIGPDGVVSVFDTFFRDLDQRLDGLRKAAADEDGETFSRLAHALSGSSAAVGGIALAARCRRAELAAIRDELHWPASLQQLEMVAAETVVALESWPGRAPPRYQ